MSSRNAYLKGEDPKGGDGVVPGHCGPRRAKLLPVYGIRLSCKELSAKCWQSEPRARVDYAEIVDAETFEPVVRVTRRCYAALAVYLGKTRLIDNMMIEAGGGRVAGGSFRAESLADL